MDIKINPEDKIAADVEVIRLRQEREESEKERYRRLDEYAERPIPKPNQPAALAAITTALIKIIREYLKPKPAAKTRRSSSTKPMLSGPGPVRRAPRINPNKAFEPSDKLMKMGRSFMQNKESPPWMK